METQLQSERKLRIAMVCDAVTDCVAGSFISTQRFAERLAAKGHHVIYIAARSPRYPSNSMHGSIKAYRFRSLLVPKSEGQLYLSFPTTREIAQVLKDEQIDIVHTMIPMPSSIAATRAATALGIKIVSHSHTQPENIFMHVPQGPWIAMINRVFYRYMSWLYGQGHALIYPSMHAQRLMKDIRTDITPLVISNGVNGSRFVQADPTAFLERFHLPSTKTIILYAGRLHPEKSLDTLIGAMPEVMRAAPDAHLVIAGFGHQEDMLRSQAKTLGVADHISFLGHISDDDMVMAQQAADIFVLPSLAELEGMVVLEAMASGNPIVIANSPESASTYFVDGNGFLFTPRDPHDLATQIIRLANNPSLRAEMGARSLALSHHYDINESVRRLEELYYSLLKDPV